MQFNRLLISLLLTGAAGACTTFAVAAASPPSLLVTAEKKSLSQSLARRVGRVARIRPGVVRALGVDQGARFQVELGGGVNVTAVVERAETDALGWLIRSGTVVNDGGFFTLAQRGEQLYANIRLSRQGLYTIRPLERGYHEIQKPKVPKEICLVGRKQQWTTRAVTSPITSAAAPVIEVLVAYTPAARLGAGGTAKMEGIVSLAAAEANDAYARSKVIARIHLASKPLEVAYTESGSISKDLDRLIAKADGELDTLHARRDAIKADLVCLIVETADGTGIGGEMRTLSTAFESDAFSVVRRDAAQNNLTFPHELGHNMGCGHNRANGGPALYKYSCGWDFDADGTRYRTIMAYPIGNSIRIPHFSNPSVTYNEVATGVPEGESSAANNALTINNSGSTVAAFR